MVTNQEIWDVIVFLVFVTKPLKGSGTADTVQLLMRVPSADLGFGGRGMNCLRFPCPGALCGFVVLGAVSLPHSLGLRPVKVAVDLYALRCMVKFDGEEVPVSF